MPTWGELLSELEQRATQGDPAPADYIRRKYLTELHQYTGRNVVLYATSWTEPREVPPELVSITESDVQALMEVLHGLSGTEGLDLILHSPGGSAEATESVVSYIRSKFNDIRIIIPHVAMSAATMLACSAQRIVMGKHSFLGPIDPQMIVITQLGPQAIPAQAIIDQFERAKIECQDPRFLAAWLPMLAQYGPALLVQCEEALKLSKELVSKWVEQYMFSGQTSAHQKAEAVANSLADHATFKTHRRHIDRNQARSIGLTIDDLESDQRMQDLVLSVFHATNHTFNTTPAVKIVENHLGRAYMKIHGVPVQVPGPIQTPAPQTPTPPPAQTPTPETMQP